MFPEQSIREKIMEELELIPANVRGSRIYPIEGKIVRVGLVARMKLPSREALSRLGVFGGHYPSPEEVVGRNERMALALREVDALPDRKEQMILFLALSGESTSEIRSRLSVTAQDVVRAKHHLASRVRRVATNRVSRVRSQRRM